MFDAEFYFEQLETPPERMTLLEHYWHCQGEQLQSPSPFFNSQAYLATYHDIADCQMNPLYHYLRFGIYERRFSFFNTGHLASLSRNGLTDFTWFKPFLEPELDLAHNLLQLNPQAPTLVCVSHDASLTGAPLIILKIAEMLRRDHGVNVVNLLCNGGELTPKFQATGPTFSLEGACPWFDHDHFVAAMKFFKHVVKPTNPLGILMNSAESRHVLEPLAELNVPMHALVHENARCYYEFQEQPFAGIGKHCERVIFPSRYVLDAAMEGSGVTEEQTEIIPQGLLRKEMLTPNADKDAQQLRSKLGIPEDGILILGCGTGDSRKGLDLFISTAISVLNRDDSQKIYFGWLGNLDTSTNTSNGFWVKSDIQVSGFSDRILMFGKHSDVRAFFDASDVFYLPSRIDPFPCVVNEAMARGLPIVLFDGGSGCVDLVTEKGGAIVPYSDIVSATESLLKLCQEKAARETAGERNRQYVCQNMKYEKYVEKLLDGFSEDIQKPRYGLSQSAAARKLTQRIKKRVQVKPAKHVFFLTPCWSVNGVNSFTENLGIELNRRGYQASVLLTTTDTIHMNLSPDQFPKIPHHYVSTRWLENAEKNHRLKTFLESMAPAVMIPNFDYISSPVSLELPDQVRTLGILHSDESEHYTHGYRMGHCWDKIVSVSDTIQSKLLELNPAFAQKAVTINYGVRASEDLVNQVHSPEAISELRIVYSGRLVQEQKRIFDFVELMDALKDRGVPFRMTLIGEGDAKEELMRLAKPYLDRGELRLTGRLTVDEVYDELLHHHVFCLMSDYEGLPLSLLEGLACGCIPVVTEIESGVSEILNHEENALFSPLRSPDLMADNMQRLYQDATLRQRLAACSRETLLTNQLTTHQMADRYEAVLEEIFASMAGNTKPSKPLFGHCPRVDRMLDAA